MNRNRNILLLRFLLGELPDMRQRAFESEMQFDPQLQHKALQWRTLIDGLQMYKPDFDHGFETRLMQRLAMQHEILLQEKQAWHLMLRFILSAAAAVVLLIIWVYMQEQSLSLEHLLGLAGLKTDDFFNLLANY